MPTVYPTSGVHRQRMRELYRRRLPATPEAVPLARHDVIDPIAAAPSHQGCPIHRKQRLRLSSGHKAPEETPSGMAAVTRGAETA